MCVSNIGGRGQGLIFVFHVQSMETAYMTVLIQLLRKAANSRICTVHIDPKTGCRLGVRTAVMQS